MLLNWIDPLKYLKSPWTSGYFYLLVAGLCAIALIVCHRAGATIGLPAILAVLGAASGAVAWYQSLGAESSSNRLPLLLAVTGLGLTCAAFLLAATRAVHFIECAIGYGILFLFVAGRIRGVLAKALLAPPMFGALVLCVGAAAGAAAPGAFPALFTTLLSAIAITTRGLELGEFHASLEPRGPQAHSVFHRTLSVLSVVFFFFGVVALWPWLGKVYGFGYFWILVIGVIVPIMALWGRIRQPRGDTAEVALSRFNRVLPYSAALMLLAIAVG